MKLAMPPCRLLAAKATGNARRLTSQSTGTVASVASRRPQRPVTSAVRRHEQLAFAITHASACPILLGIRSHLPSP